MCDDSLTVETNILDWFQRCEEFSVEKTEIVETTLLELEQKLSNYIKQLPSSLIENRRNLLLALRFNELFNIHYWIMTCIKFGFYETAIRELRYTIDVILQAVYIDKVHHSVDINSKLIIQEALEQWRGFMGTRLAKKIRLSTQNEIQGLYSELSEYVHGSIQELRPKINQVKQYDSLALGLRKPRFNPQMQRKALGLSRKILDLIFRIHDEFKEWYVQYIEKTQ